MKSADNLFDKHRNQKTETSVAVRCLNSVTALGMPVSTKIT